MINDSKSTTGVFHRHGDGSTDALEPPRLCCGGLELGEGATRDSSASCIRSNGPFRSPRDDGDDGSLDDAIIDATT